MFARLTDVDGPRQSDKGKWKQVVVSYENENGEIKKQTLVSFGDGKSAYDAFANGDFGVGDDVEFEMKKNGNYWNVVGVEQATGMNKSTKPKAEGAPKAGRSGDWETSEERRLRNLTICRQNALTAAVNFVTRETAQDLDTKTVLDIADKFFHYTAQEFITPKDVEKVVEKQFK